MFFLIFAGVVSLVFGILFLFFPVALRNLNDKANLIMTRSLASLDENIMKMRLGVGISLILASILSFFVILYIIKRSG
ncbi:MAG: hypothetical protein C4533_06260 [Candidatus Omnitrophota bacterium]|jgi:hypothetical protein|nr:MAG: hypothetical protein C4533_06260 [Candidatus Omnitrophota bacterium]